MPDLKPLSHKEQDTSPGISRRELLLGIGAAASVAYAGTAFSAKPGHDHSKHAAQLPDLLNATNGCVDKGQRCIAHCLVSFQEGDVELRTAPARCTRCRLYAVHFPICWPRIPNM